MPHNEIRLNTRLLLRYDSYENWMATKPVLLAGEVAVATIANQEGNTSLNHNSVALPQVLIKVGDGTSSYDLLPFASALAADVHPWAKETQAQFENRVKTLVAGLKFASAADLDALEALVGTLPEGATATTVVGYIGEVKTALSAEIDADVKVVADDLAGYKTTNDAALAGVKATAEAAVTDAKLATALEPYATKTEAQGYADAKDEAIAAAKKAGDDAQVDVNALAELVGTLPEDTTAETIVAYVDVKTADIASGEAMTQLTNRVTAAEEAIDAIEADYVKAADIANFETKENVKAVADDLAAYKETNDAAVALKADQTDLDKTDETVAALKARVEAFLDNTGAATEAIYTLQELITYIETHDDVEMADLVADIQALENKTVLGTDAEGNEYATVKAYVEAAVKAEADRATDAENSLDERLDAVEAKFEGDNSVDNKIAVALASAQQYTDDEITELVTNGAVKVNADAIAAINDETTGILAEAKAYADGLNTAMDTRVDALEATVNGTGEGEAHVKGLTEKVADNTAAIVAINNAESGILAQAKQYTNDEIAKLSATDGALTILGDRVKANEDKLVGIDGTVIDVINAAKAGIATTTAAGLVKASDAVTVAEDGTMGIAKVSTDILFNGNKEFVLYGGTADGFTN